MPQPPNQAIYRYLDTNGDGTGTKNAIGNYAAVTQFKIAPPAGTFYDLERVVIQIGDAGDSSAEDYGSGSALGNGITAKVFNGSDAEVLDLTDGVPITSNASWGQVCYDVASHNWGTTPTNDFITVRWTFAKAGSPLILDGNDGDYLAFILNDNFSGLLTHYFMVQGYKR